LATIPTAFKVRFELPPELFCLPDDVRHDLPGRHGDVLAGAYLVPPE
jgi:hypothetical protein